MSISAFINNSYLKYFNKTYYTGLDETLNFKNETAFRFFCNRLSTRSVRI